MRSFLTAFLVVATVLAGMSVSAMPLGLRIAMWNASKAERQEETSFGVAFDALGGVLTSGESVVTQECDTVYGTLPVATREGYRFLGWFTAAEGGELVTSETIVSHDLTTIYAHWRINDGTYDIVVSVAPVCEAMGKVTGGKTAKAGTKLTLKATPNKGYVFSHWEGPLDDVTDPRSPSIAYVVGEEDVQFTAHFIPVDEDTAVISFEMADEYVTGDVIASVAVDVSECTSLPTVKVTGLPAGLKFTAKDVLKKGSQTEVEYPANTIYGTPTKSGVYTVVATVTTAGKKTATCSQTIVVRKDGEKIVKVESDAEAGKVTGAGIYQTGKSATLKATANKGYVFAGWYEDGNFDAPCDSTVADYRNPSYAYTMGEMDKMFYARFEPVAADTNLNLTVDGVAVVPGENPLKSFTVGCATNMPLSVESLSLPKISVKGLPDGLKFTEKPVYKKGSKTEIETPANSIYGTPTKPGVYKVSVSLTNTSIKKALVNDFEIVVPNLTDGMIVVEDEYGPYVPGVAYTNTIDAAAGCSVSGLPAGMKWTAKAIVDNKTKTEIIPANSFYGAPTKPGKYTVYFTKTIDKVKHTATATFIVGDFPVVNVVTIGSGTGKVTGAGAFAANKKVTLKATADTKDDAKKGTKKSVFAGWYLDEDGYDPAESSADYRTASLPYVMTAAPETTLYAMFVTQEEDSDIKLYVDGCEITVDAADNNFVAEGTKVLGFELESISVPKAAVSGLPAGMKFTDKALTVKATKTEEAYDVPANSIYGTPTKPGIYTVTVKLTNTTVKKAIEKKFTIEVPNLTAANGYFYDYLYNGIGDMCTISVGVSNASDLLPNLETVDGVKLAVSGLPAGLKYNAKTGKITGVATKAGVYTVTLTVTDGKEKYVSTITVEVEALPDWVVGTFNGYIDGFESYAGDWVDWVTITINSSGKVSYKDLTESGNYYVVNPNDITFEMDGYGGYKIVIEQSGVDWYSEKNLTIRPENIGGNVIGVIEGSVTGADIEDGGAWEEPTTGYFYACQNVWATAKGTKLAPEFVKNTAVAVSMDYMRDDEWDWSYGGSLAIKFGSNGAVTTAYSEREGGKATATGSAQLVPYEVDGDTIRAWLYTALKPKGREPFGVLLFLSIDTSRGIVYGSDVSCDDYLLEVDD